MASASASTSVVDAAPPMSGACKAMMDASQKKLDDAKSARACTPAFDKAQLECHTSSNGATWGLRVDDVVDLGAEPCKTGWLVRLVHVDLNGAETAVVPGISQNQRAHTYNVALDMKVQDVLFFDWDGDGDDEVFVHGVRGTGDQPEEERAQIWSFLSGDAGTRIAPFPPSSSFTIVGTQDVDADGRPDLMVTFFGTGKDAPPTSRRFAAHSLKDGTFSVKDTAAVTWGEKQCPSDPTLDLSSFDGAVADAMVCAEIWGHDLSKACPPRVRSAGTESSGAGKSCPPWAEKLAKTKPPVSLK